MILVFTDGSTFNNGKKNATGGIGVYIVETNLVYEPLSELEFSETVENPTNQKCELLAIKKAIELINEKYPDYKGNIMIYSDSMYCINCITKWATAWKNNGWKNTRNQDVKNQLIIKDILDLIKPNISFYHVLSHQDKPKSGSMLEILKWNGNNKADSLAKNRN